MNCVRTTVAMWICLALSVSGIPGVVLCVSDNGRVALEPSFGGRHGDIRCGGDGTHGEAESVASVDDTDEHCGECEDVPLQTDTLKHSSRRRSLSAGIQVPSHNAIAPPGPCSAGRMPAISRNCRSHAPPPGPLPVDMLVLRL